MKLLADMGVSQTVVKSLRAMDYDAKHLREEGLQCLPDALIIEKAKIEGQEGWVGAGRASYQRPLPWSGGDVTLHKFCTFQLEAVPYI